MRETGAYRAHDDPLRGHLMDQRGWPEAVNDVVGRPPPGQEVDTGTFVAGRIINILAPRPFRWYRLPECFRDTPMPLRFPWQPELPAELCDDARAERVLDDLWQADPQQVLRAAVPQVIQRATSLTAIRAMWPPPASASPEPMPINRTRGCHSSPRGQRKDVRPDLKPRRVGVGMTRDGVLLVGAVASVTLYPIDYARLAELYI